MRAIRIAVLVTLLGLGGALAWHGHLANGPAPRETLPDLSLAALAGRDGFDPASIESTYLLNVWASWCGPCRIEHPTLMALAAEGYPIYGINWQDHPDDANTFLDTYGNPYAGIMQDVNGQSARALAVSGAPETLVISADGNILFRWPGPITLDVLRNHIYPLFEQAAQH